MKFLKNFFNFYINSSIHVALAVYSLVRITEFYFELPYNEPLDYFIFYGTITGYNFVKYAAIAKLHHKSLTNNLKLIQIFSFVCFGLTLFYANKLPLETLLFFAPFGFLTVLYAVPILSKNLRNIASLKIVIIAFVWAGVTVFLPLADGKTLDISSDKILIFIQRLLFVVALTLPFDIRDVQFDVKSLKTIPQKIGVEKTKKLGFLMLAFCLLIEFVVTPNPSFRTVFLSVFFMLLFFLMRAGTKQSKFYSSFWVEAIPIFWFLLLIIAM